VVGCRRTGSIVISTTRAAATRHLADEKRKKEALVPGDTGTSCHTPDHVGNGASFCGAVALSTQPPPPHLSPSILQIDTIIVIYPKKHIFGIISPSYYTILFIAEIRHPSVNYGDRAQRSYLARLFCLTVLLSGQC
jgi:hypothetical protein